MEFLITFFIFLFGGEATILSFTALAATGQATLWIILINAYLTALIGELFWFWFVKTALFNRLSKVKFFQKFSVFSGNMDNLSQKTPFMLLLISRASYFGVVAVIYLSKNKLPFKKFLLYSLGINAGWEILMCSIGWLVGKGFAKVGDYFKMSHLVINGAIVLIGILWIFKPMVVKYFSKVSKEEFVI